RTYVRLSYSFGSCDSHWLATHRGYFEKTSKSSGRKQDRSLPIPVASPSVGSIGQHSRSAAYNVDAFQFAIGKESYRHAVGRPDWIACSVCSRQRLCRKRIQGPDPELGFAVIRCHENQPPAIG